MSSIYFISSKNNILISKVFAFDIDYELKFCKIENYLKVCDNNAFKNDGKAYKKMNNPKVSINNNDNSILNNNQFNSNLLNQQINQINNKLLRLFISIRYQKFEGIIIIEIILIDDYSTDNCANEIKKLMKSGNRIILLKKVKK